MSDTSNQPIFKIEAASYGILGTASHDYWILRGPDNEIVAELHGKASSQAIDSLGNISWTSLTIGTETTDKLKIWQYIPNTAYSNGVDLLTTFNRVGYQSGESQDIRDTKVVFSGSKEEALARFNAAVAGANIINKLDRPYSPLGFSIFSPTINSNTAYSTLAELMGLAPYDFPWRIEPGFDYRLITPGMIDALKYKPGSSGISTVVTTDQATGIKTEITNSYDFSGRLLNTTITTTSYDGKNVIITETVDGAVKYKTEYTINSDGSWNSRESDGNNNITAAEKVNVDNSWSRTEYDLQNSMSTKTEVSSDGSYVDSHYKDGKLVSQEGIDQNNVELSREYDSEERITKETLVSTDPADGSTTTEVTNFRPDGTPTDTTTTEVRDGDGTTTEVTNYGADGNPLDTTVTTTSEDGNTTTTERYNGDSSEPYQLETSRTNPNDGTTTTITKDLNPDGSTADGTLTVTSEDGTTLKTYELYPDGAWVDSDGNELSTADSQLVNEYLSAMSLDFDVNDDDGTLDQIINNIHSSFSTAETTRSPLVLDLNGDGVKTTPISNKTYFDFDANGFAEQTGWISKDDGLLVWDKNGNGVIDNGTELFGNNTLLKNGSRASNGFVALAELDDNHNGRIDVGDAAYGQLRILRDGQLLTLVEAGVQSINTAYANQNVTDASGNQHLQTGTFTKNDGTTAIIDDVWFKVDTAKTTDTTNVEISHAIASLPDLKAFGNVHSLHEAMALDSTGRLQTLVEQFAAETDPTARKDIMLHIMYSWAGVENVDPNSRAATRYYGNAIGDARKLETLEAFLGEKYLGTWCWGERDPNPHGPASKILLKTFDDLTNYMAQQLMVQTHLKSLFDGVTLAWNASSESFYLNIANSVSLLSSAYLSNPDKGTQLMAEFAASLQAQGDFGRQVLDALRKHGDTAGSDFTVLLSTIGFNAVVGDGNSNYLSAIANQDNALFGLAGDDVITGQNGFDRLYGGGGNDSLYGNAGNDTLYGEVGDDSLHGGSGNDILDGGAGNDLLQGDAGNDTYIYGRGSGNDVVMDNYGSNNVIFSGLIPADIVVTTPAAYSDELTFTIRDTGETLRISSNWNNDSFFKFADGTIWSKADALHQTVAKPTEGDDTIVGSIIDDTIAGLGGSDIIYGNGGNDILDGGTGDDVLQGGYGDDTYVWGLGAGRDVIIEQNYSVNNQDTIELTAGVIPDDLIIRRVGDDMVLTINGTDDQLTVKSGFNDYSDYGRIEQIRFSDGTSWDAATMQARALWTTDSNDTIVGFKSDDIIDGKAGNDLLKGGSGSDTYLFGRGSGNDTITEEWDWSSTDTVRFMDGLTPSDLHFSVDQNDLLITIKDTGETLCITYGSWSNIMIERFSFSDGTSLTWNDVKLLTTVPPSSESLVGTPGDDTLTGTDLDSTILGLEGNDILTGAGGNDTIEGGAGDDTLKGGAGRDYLNGGTGANTYLFEQGTGVDYIQARLADGSDDTILFAAGITAADLQVQLGNQRYWDIQPGDSGYATLVVGTGDDAFKIEIDGWNDITRSSIKRFVFSDGSELAIDQIIALNDGGIAGYQYGSGRLIGSNSDDEIYGDYTDDVIRARAGNDYIDAGEGNDRVYGGAGDDRLYGGSGSDLLDSGKGDDELNGGAGDDLLDAGKGDDYLYGNSGNDILVGGKGDDSLNGGSGLDTYLFNRGDGNDYLETPWEGGNRTLSFGTDIILSDVSAFVNESGQLVLQVNNGIDGSLTMDWFDRSTMTAYDQLPLQQVQFVDAGGNATIFDLVGLVQARLGALANSDAGHTTSLFENAGEFDITFSAMPAGGDTAVAYAQTGDLFGTATYTASTVPSDGDDRIVGTQWDDAINGGNGNDLIYGLDGDDYLEGGAGFDRIDAGAGNDIIYGGTGNDLIMAGDGDDTIYAGPGNDIAYGGFGNDTYVFNTGDGTLTIEDDYREVVDDGYGGGEGGGDMPMFAALSLVDGGGGDYGGTATTVANVLQFGVGITLADLKFSTANGYLVIDIPTTGDQVRLAGYDPDRPTLTRAVDVYRFSDGSEADPTEIFNMGLTTIGSGGDDDLQGTEANDTVLGGLGDDYLAGGWGNDRLEGGAGNDTYLFNLGDGTDTIVDISVEGMENSIQFGYGISLDSIKTEIVDGSLVLRVGDTGDALRLDGFDPTIPNISRPVEYINFGDGTSISLDELLAMKAGDAYQQGGHGSNTYVFNQGDGVVTISDFKEEGVVNTLRLGPNILVADLQQHLFFETPTDSASGQGTLVIKFDNGDEVRLDGFSPDDVDNSPRSVDVFHFDDGTTVSFAELVRMTFMVEGDALDNSLIGTNLVDNLYGHQGDDALNGGSGRDTYVFNLGDGNDRIIDAAEAGIGNIVSFGDGISFTDVSFALDGTTLTINYGNLGDQIRVENFDPSGVNGSSVIDTFIFADSFEATYRELTNHIPTADMVIGDIAMLQGQTLNFQLPSGTFNDLDGEQLTYRAFGPDESTLPAWLSFDRSTGIFSGSPGNDDVGSIVVTVTATDDFSGMASQSFTITVDNVNDAPELVTAIENQATVQDQPFSFVIPESTFKDIDADDSLTLSVTLADGSALPAWLAFDAATSTFSGTPANGDVGNLNLLVTATDVAGATVSSQFNVAVANVNDAPTVTTVVADQAALEDQPFTMQLPANLFSDIDAGDVLTLSATLADGSALPDWLSFDASTATLTGNPGNDQVGSLKLSITATDQSGATVLTGFNLNVGNVNDAPVVFTEIGGKRAVEDELFRFQLPADTFKDVDSGDVLTYSATLADGSALPAWLTFDASTGTFSGIPDNSNVGTLQVSVTATDLAGTSATATFGLETINTNDAPLVGDPVSTQTSTEDQPFSFTLPATAFKDLDAGDQLSYSATLANGDPLPAWLQFDAATATLSGTPGNDNVGNLDLRVTATDMAGANASSNFSIAVANTNDAPELLTPLVAQTATEDQGFSYQIPADTFKDIDAGDQLTYSATMANGSVLPSWLSFNAATATLTGTPGNDQVGSLDLNITATDRSGATAHSLFSLNVTNVNDAPVLVTPLADQNAKQGQAFSYQIPTGSFIDIDKGDTLSYSASLSNGNPLPAWLTFNPATGTFSGTPDSASVGNIALNLTATDQAGASATDSFNLTVAATSSNSAPIATPDTATLTEDRCPPVASGNLLTNDHDPNAGDKLTVVNPGFKQGDYGYLGIGADGKYGYLLNNLSYDVQSLGRSTQVVDHFGYTVSDGKLSATSSLDITIKGTNDAPIIAHHLADQSVKNNKAFSFTMPSDSFVDIDKGDSLSYTASLANGKALPSWLKFDAKTGTFSGTAPKSAGYLDIRVTATDKVAATGSTEGSLSASDVFQLSFGKSNKGSSNCYDDDANDNHNDNFDWIKKAGFDHHDNDHDNRWFGRDDDHHDTHHSDSSAANPIHYLDSEQLDAYLHEFDNDKTGSSHSDDNIAKRWLMVSRALAYDLAELGDEQGRNHRLGADTGAFGRDIAGTIGSTHAFGMDTTLASGNCGTDLKGFKGLNEGIKRM